MAGETFSFRMVLLGLKFEILFGLAKILIFVFFSVMN